MSKETILWGIEGQEILTADSLDEAVSDYVDNGELEVME